jgi:hypothetical protein
VCGLLSTRLISTVTEPRNPRSRQSQLTKVSSSKT